jgi:hypothetical protein
MKGSLEVRFEMAVVMSGNVVWSPWWNFRFGILIAFKDFGAVPVSHSTWTSPQHAVAVAKRIFFFFFFFLSDSQLLILEKLYYNIFDKHVKIL